MNDTKLEVDVHAHWSDDPPVYRIYVNEEMFAERTFTWPSFKNYITEHIFCNLDKGIHKIKLEHFGKNSRFDLVNLKVNTKQIDIRFIDIQTDKIEWIFIVSH